MATTEMGMIERANELGWFPTEVEAELIVHCWMSEMFTRFPGMCRNYTYGQIPKTTILECKDWAINKVMGVVKECPLVYLASPYSHPDPLIRIARFEAACRATSRLMKSGMLVFSPIAQSHSVAIHGGTPVDWAFWEAYDTAVLAGCGKLLVLRLDGWDRSVGVAAEIDIMRKAGKPVEYIDPDPADLVPA